MSNIVRRFRRGWLEAVLLAVLAFGPFLIASRAAANGNWWTACNGWSIGSYCLSFFDDPTVCQDCAQFGCDWTCNPLEYSFYQYMRCVEISFTICLGA